MPQKTEADKLDSVEERPVIIRCRRKTNGEGCLEHGLANLLVAVDLKDMKDSGKMLGVQCNTLQISKLNVQDHSIMIPV